MDSTEFLKERGGTNGNNNNKEVIKETISSLAIKESQVNYAGYIRGLVIIAMLLSSFLVSVVIFYWNLTNFKYNIMIIPTMSSHLPFASSYLLVYIHYIILL